MMETTREREVCAVCRREADEGHSFCHFYRESGRLAFCSPHCADVFLQRELEKPEDAWRAREHVAVAFTNVTEPGFRS